MAVDQYRRSIASAKAFSAALEELGAEVATKVGVSANRRAAKVLQDRLVATAPYQNGQPKGASARYGHLRDNIRIKKQKAAKQGHIVHFVTTGRAFWGKFLEYGTRRMRARPWFRPVFEANRDALLNAHIDELRTGIDHAAKRAARRAKRGL